MGVADDGEGAAAAHLPGQQGRGQGRGGRGKWRKWGEGGSGGVGHAGAAARAGRLVETADYPWPRRCRTAAFNPVRA